MNRGMEMAKHCMVLIVLLGAISGVAAMEEGDTLERYDTSYKHYFDNDQARKQFDEVERAILQHMIDPKKGSINSLLNGSALYELFIRNKVEPNSTISKFLNKLPKHTDQNPVYSIDEKKGQIIDCSSDNPVYPPKKSNWGKHWFKRKKYNKNNRFEIALTPRCNSNDQELQKTVSLFLACSLMFKERKILFSHVAKISNFLRCTLNIPLETTFYLSPDLYNHTDRTYGLPSSDEVAAFKKGANDIFFIEEFWNMYWTNIHGIPANIVTKEMIQYLPLKLLMHAGICGIATSTLIADQIAYEYIKFKILKHRIEYLKKLINALHIGTYQILPSIPIIYNEGCSNQQIVFAHEILNIQMVKGFEESVDCHIALIKRLVDQWGLLEDNCNEKMIYAPQRSASTRVVESEVDEWVMLNIPPTLTFNSAIGILKQLPNRHKDIQNSLNGLNDALKAIYKKLVTCNQEDIYAQEIKNYLRSNVSIIERPLK
jgi:hypothetical protein